VTRHAASEAGRDAGVQRAVATLEEVAEPACHAAILAPRRSWADLAQRRDRRFRRGRALRVRTARAALAFVDDVGFCSTFYCFAEGVPCLWEAVVGRARPRWPRHSHHDDGVGVTWQLKDELPAARRVYYGKILKQRPTLVALDLLPSFYALVRGRQRARDYVAEYEAGRLSHTARRLMDALMRERPQYTRRLRGETFMLDSSKTREFERAMAELQQGLWVVKTEERYEPTFSYRWELVEAWLPDLVAEGRRLARAAAVDRLISRYLAGAVFTTPARLRRLFSLSAAETGASVSRLVRAGVVRDVAVKGWPGNWLVHGGGSRG
jgi:winged helix DNA-binding protein